MLNKRDFGSRKHGKMVGFHSVSDELEISIDWTTEPTILTHVHRKIMILLVIYWLYAVCLCKLLNV